MLTFLILVASIALVGWGMSQRAVVQALHNDRVRRAKLFARFNDQQVVDMIMGRMFWVGQTAEQLEESLGRPAEIDRKALQTKDVQIWKFGQTSRHRFNIKITLENGIVTKFEQKGA